MRTHCTRTRTRTYYMFCTRTHAHTHCAHAHTPDVVNCSSERPAYVFLCAIVVDSMLLDDSKNM